MYRAVPYAREERADGGRDTKDTGVSEQGPGGTSADTDLNK